MDSLKCTRCGHENSTEAVSCEKCGHRLQRSGMPVMILVLILLLLLYPLIGLIRVPTVSEQEVEVEEPVSIVREVSWTEPVEKYVCENRSHRYSTLGGNVDFVDGSLVPDLIINNLEERWGLFQVNFSFINDDKFPYKNLLNHLH